MGRSYGAGDNASMESSFSLLQKNVLNTRRWDTRDDLRLEMVRWIDTKYNRRRRQRGLGRLTPVEFEMIYAAAGAARTPRPLSINQSGGSFQQRPST